MKFLGNIIWLIFGGLITSIEPAAADGYDHRHSIRTTDIETGSAGFVAFW